MGYLIDHSTTVPYILVQFNGNKPTALEMKQNHQNKNLSVSLRPLWKLTFWTGILLDWCVINHSSSIQSNHWKKYVASFIRWCTSSISLALLVLLGFFQMYQMLTVEKHLSLNVIVTYFLRVSSIPISLFLHLSFIFRRKKLLEFFKDFQDSEEIIPHYFFTGEFKKNPYTVMMQTLIYFLCRISSASDDNCPSNSLHIRNTNVTL